MCCLVFGSNISRTSTFSKCSECSCCLLTFEKSLIFVLFWDSTQFSITPWHKPEIMHLRSLSQFKCAL
jgi:hypothetical protein